ncbi:AsmA-like protein [Mucilaginibacter gracilis]|uniref:AsmA-like protein n=1 Tax=Mucilaginibacter gracilis TaxID=423350 RepID=A0A495J413_9SPHI|nr:AsmA-like C-terminal region-containing protein [Mucilaginibacter gracilis]RKR83563.1 AsmA-like protein [Mucilaginibacter gracilis]
MPALLKTILKIVGSLILVIALLIVAAFAYITLRKDKFLKMVNTELNKSVDGTVIIGNMHPMFFKRFPNISLGLENVLIRDKRFNEHHHTLLDAKNFDLSVNTANLLTGTIAINHLAISNASIDLYTDSTGYSNTSLFKKGPKKTDNKSSKNESPAQIGQFSLTNVGFKVDDQRARKLFDFVINNIDGKMRYPDSGWYAAFHMDITAKSMAFSTQNGSFIKNKALEGNFTAGFNAENGKINVQTDRLAIGDDPFQISAVFETGKPAATFLFHIYCNELLWQHASALLAQNIAVKLNQFNMAKPIAVKAIISGSFSGGDPYLYITAKVKNNTVTIPGSTIDDCSFDGVFTNNYKKGKGLSDSNSVIRLIGMTGSYQHLPFKIDTGNIINLNKPIATGNFSANFPVANLNYLLGAKIAKFSKGSANINLRYKADIVDYRINKPTVAGSISFKNTDIYYLPSNLKLNNTSLTLNFEGDNLILSNIRLQTGRSIVFMNGRVNNFLNLYYNSPEKILLTWNISSPQMYLGEFLGVLGGNGASNQKTKNSGNAIDQLSNVLQKGSAKMHLEVAKLHYNKFLATNVKADLLTSPNGVAIQNVGLKTAGGSLSLNGGIKKSGARNGLNLNTTVHNVNVQEFFESFNNFGMKDFTSDNLRGTLSAKTQITGIMDNNASLIGKSINGNLNISLTNAALVNFKPLVSVGKFAFPFRDLKNIRIPKLDAKFAIKGEKIEISPMQISSSVLNMDVAGTYGLNKGTNIALDIPLRNPKGDSTITDKQELQKKRFKGIVIHLLAKTDEETGKVKISLNKHHKDTDK